MEPAELLNRVMNPDNSVYVYGLYGFIALSAVVSSYLLRQRRRAERKEPSLQASVLNAESDPSLLRRCVEAHVEDRKGLRRRHKLIIRCSTLLLVGGLGLQIYKTSYPLFFGAFGVGLAYLMLRMLLTILLPGIDCPFCGNNTFKYLGPSRQHAGRRARLTRPFPNNCPHCSLPLSRDALAARIEMM